MWSTVTGRRKDILNFIGLYFRVLFVSNFRKCLAREGVSTVSSTFSPHSTAVTPPHPRPAQASPHHRTRFPLESS